MNPVIEREAPKGQEPIKIELAGQFVKFGETSSFAPFCQLCSQVIISWLALKAQKQAEQATIKVGKRQIILPGKPPEYRG